MKNFEKYEKEIKDIGIVDFAVMENGKMINCLDNFECNKCIFIDTDCISYGREKTHWLYREYEPPIDYLNLETQKTEENIIFEANKELANNNFITNCGSCMVDILSSQDRHFIGAISLNFYRSEFIEWLQAKSRKQINFDLENDSFGRLLKKIRKPSIDELEEMFKEEK